LERLWAPWRMKYIRELAKIKKPKGCIFCDARDSKNDRDKLVLYRGDSAFILLNLFPYNTGHIMVAPYRHVASLEKLEITEVTEIFSLIKLSVRLLKNTYSPEGFNIGVNIGRVSGAGVEDHIHVHIVPRWCGDTNFMPIISNTKVIPEALYDTYDELRRSLHEVISLEKNRC